MKFNSFAVLVVIALFSFNAKAGNVEITADNGIEWHQNDNKMVAEGNAKAVREKMVLKAEKISAFYNDKEKDGNSKINLIKAEENVSMNDMESKAYGDSADYYVEKGLMFLRGKPAKIMAGNDIIKADDVIEIYLDDNKSIARGNAHAKKEDSDIYADVMTIFFIQGKKDKEIHKVEVFGNVKIKTPTETITGNKGVYLVKEGVASVNGNVEIDQQDNKLKGEYAKINLNTGVSKLFAGKKNKVQGVFKTEDKTEKKED